MTLENRLATHDLHEHYALAIDALEDSGREWVEVFVREGRGERLLQCEVRYEIARRKFRRIERKLRKALRS